MIFPPSIVIFLNYFCITLLYFHSIFCRFLFLLLTMKCSFLSAILAIFFIFWFFLYNTVSGSSFDMNRSIYSFYFFDFSFQSIAFTVIFTNPSVVVCFKISVRNFSLSSLAHIQVSMIAGRFFFI